MGAVWKSAVEALGHARTDILVSNAGINGAQTLAEFDADT